MISLMKQFLDRCHLQHDLVTFQKNIMSLREPSFLQEYNLKEKMYLVLTVHRPANVDETEKLKFMMEEIISNSNDMPIIFPIHPRTSKIINSLNITTSNLIIVDPLDYLEFNYLVKNSFAVITDSGDITKETTVMGITCLTLRDNTERPETITIGTNVLVGTNPKNIKSVLNNLFSGNWKKGNIPELWHGHAAERIVSQLVNL